MSPPTHTLTRAERRALQDKQRQDKLVKSMDPASSTEVVVIRHGETAWNLEQRLQGQSTDDPGLTERGWGQAEALGQVFAGQTIDAIYSSDLKRAADTATVIARQCSMQVRTTQGLRERNLGVLQGLCLHEAPAVQPEAYAVIARGPPSARIPGGGESEEDLIHRVSSEVVRLAAAHVGGRILVVAHGGVIRALHQHATGSRCPEKVVNGSISVIRVHGPKLAMVCFNSKEHLAGTGSIASAFGGGMGEG